MMTGQIDRHSRDFDIDVKPCKDYTFRVRKQEITNYLLFLYLFFIFPFHRIKKCFIESPNLHNLIIFSHFKTKGL